MWCAAKRFPSTIQSSSAGAGENIYNVYHHIVHLFTEKSFTLRGLLNFFTRPRDNLRTLSKGPAASGGAQRGIRH